MAEKKEKIILRITNLRHPANFQIEMKDLVAKEIDLLKKDILKISILRKSTDARQKRTDFVYTVSVTAQLPKSILEKILQKKNVELHRKKSAEKLLTITGLKTRPVIVGCGPAGIFAAITLVERGIAPIVIERGERIDDRVKSVAHFWKKGVLNPESNTLFGEGGAGTFSDGKLTTRIKTPLKEKVLKEFIKAGADEEILYLSKPHLGTDRIRQIVSRIVEELKSRGVEFIFNTPVTDIITDGDCVTGVTAGNSFIRSDNVFLATGHSARSIYDLLLTKRARIEPKGFAVGLRIEHPQEFIDKMQGGNTDTPAEYFFSCKDKQENRGVYTFCMCPGGSVIGCSSSSGELCTNGMSTSSRSSGMANSAIVVTVRPGDFPSGDALGGINFQRQLERVAFKMGGGGFFAPIQRASDFIAQKTEFVPDRGFEYSYLPGTKSANLCELLPDFISGPLRRGLEYFDKKTPGFIEEGGLIGVETRTSSPVRILRNPKNFHTLGLRGLLPVGEGSGYAGGIVSSATDAIMGAMRFNMYG